MASINEIMQTYQEKKQEYDETVGKYQQYLMTLQADIKAIPQECVGQSEEWIAKKTQSITNKMNDAQKKVEDFMKEQQEKIEKWLAVEKQKVEDGLKKMAEAELNVIKLKTQLEVQAMTGQEMPPGEEEEQIEEISKKNKIPIIYDESHYAYSFKDINGVWWRTSAQQAAKRKGFVGNMLTASDKRLKISGLKRDLIPWKYQVAFTYWDNDGKKYRGSEVEDHETMDPDENWWTQWVPSWMNLNKVLYTAKIEFEKGSNVKQYTEHISNPDYYGDLTVIRFEDW